MLSILIISYQYVPHVGPRVFRWRAIAEHWAAQGHHIDVVCAQSGDAPPYEQVDGVYVHRVYTPMKVGLEHSFDLQASDYVEDRHSASEKRLLERLTVERVYKYFKRRAKLRLRVVARERHVRKLYRKVWKHFYWPDDQGTWVLSARHVARRLLGEHEHDLVISVSWRFSSHVVAFLEAGRARRWGWLVDIGDPFAFNEMHPPNNLKIYRRLNFRIERQIFRKADTISVTTEPTRERYAALFPESANKIHVIPPMADPLPDRSVGEAVLTANGRVRLVFTGSLRRENRRPNNLLAIFSQLIAMPGGKNLELHFVGDIRQCLRAFDAHFHLIGKQIQIHGIVEHEIAQRFVQEADILVNIGNATDYQLPSKVAEYVASGKPIVNVASIENDSSAIFFKDYPAFLNLYVRGRADIAQAAQRVHDFITDPPRVVEPDRIEAIVAPYTKEAVIAQYDRLARLTLEGRPSHDR